MSQDYTHSESIIIQIFTYHSVIGWSNEKVSEILAEDSELDRNISLATKKITTKRSCELVSDRNCLSKESASTIDGEESDIQIKRDRC